MSSKNLTVLPLAARTASVNSDDQASSGSTRGLVLVVVSTALAATPSVVFKIQGKDKLGNYYDVPGAATAAVTTAAPTTTLLTVYPGLTASANAVVNQVLPKVWRVVATAGDSDSLTYSVTANLID